MGSVARDIFKAIHEQKWLSVEYRNMHERVTHYWIGINDVNPQTRILDVDGLHLGNHRMGELTIRLDSIVSSAIVEVSKASGEFFIIQ